MAAKRYMKLRQGLPENCMERDGSWRTVVTSLLSYLFVISSEDNNECMSYARAIVIEPLFEVTPMNAIMSTFSNLLLTPMQLCAKTLNNVFRSLLEGLPPLMVPVVLIVILYMITLVVVCYNRYSINIPCLLNVNPHPVQQPVKAVKHVGRKRATIATMKLMKNKSVKN